MKKSLLVLALVAQTASASVEISKSKFYGMVCIGAQTMYSSASGLPNAAESKIVRKQLVDNDPKNAVQQYNLATLQSAWGSPGFLGKLEAGYDCQIPNSCFVWGGFIGGGWTNNDVKNTYFGSSQTANSESPITPNLKVTSKGFFNVGFRLGASAGNAMPFILIGYSWHSLSANLARLGAIAKDQTAADLPLQTGAVSYNQFRSQKLSKGVSCLLTGAGIEYNITPALILGLRAEFHIGSKRTFTFANNLFTNEDGHYVQPVVKVKPIFSQVLFTLSYAFPTCRK